MGTTLEKPYNARRMRDCFTLERQQPEPDPSGRRRWKPVDSEVWGELKARQPTEVVSGQKIEGVGTHTLRIRFRDDVHSSMRFVHKDDGRVFNIKGPPINVEERDRWLDLALVHNEGNPPDA